MKNAMKLVAFLLILVVLFTGFIGAFNYKSELGPTQWNNFYKLDRDSVDVIFYGSSHVFDGVNTAELWEDYGIASYDMCGSLQPMWCAYYSIVETLKTQTPSCIVVDCFSAVKSAEYCEPTEQIMNTYGMRPSLNKLRCVKATTEEDNWLDFMLEYPTLHKRYLDMSETEMNEYGNLPNGECWKGFYLLDRTVPFEQNDYESFEMNNGYKLSDKNEEYLRKIIELSKERDVPLVLMVCPYVVTEYEMEIYQQIEEIAAEYDVDFENFIYETDKIGIDFSTMYADSGHLNYKGSEVFSEYLGAYLQSKYQVPDKRGTSGYEDYDDNCISYHNQVKRAELCNEKGILAYTEKLSNENYFSVISISTEAKNSANYQKLKEGLSVYGIDPDAITEGYGTFVLDGGELVYAAPLGTDLSLEYNWHQKITEKCTIEVKNTYGYDAVNETGYSLPTFYKNHDQYDISKSDFSIYVYDKALDQTAEFRAVNLDEWSDEE